MGQRRRDGVRWSRIVLVAIVVAIVNVPYLLHEWELHRVATAGVPVTATVVDVTDAGDGADVAVRFPASVDPGQGLHTAKVNREAGLEARRTGRIDARVSDGHPTVFHLDGQVRSNSALFLTLGADLLVAVLLLLSWRLGGRIRRPRLVGIAVEDVRGGDPGSLLDRQDDGTYVVNGEVASTGPTSLVLSLRDRDVEIHLRDHDNPIAVGERARVRAQLVG
jgi:hypothetical protein